MRLSCLGTFGTSKFRKGMTPVVFRFKQPHFAKSKMPLKSHQPSWWCAARLDDAADWETVLAQPPVLKVNERVTVTECIQVGRREEMCCGHVVYDQCHTYFIHIYVSYIVHIVSGSLDTSLSVPLPYSEYERIQTFYNCSDGFGPATLWQPRDQELKLSPIHRGWVGVEPLEVVHLYGFYWLIYIDILKNI